MSGAMAVPVIVAMWQGAVEEGWSEKAKELLDTKLNAHLSYTFKSVGLFGEFLLKSKTTDSELKLTVNAIGKTRGVLKRMGDDTHVFLLFLMALSKVAPFNITDADSKSPRISCNPDNPYFKDLNVSSDKIEEIGVLLGLAISDKDRQISGSAMFF